MDVLSASSSDLFVTPQSDYEARHLGRSNLGCTAVHEELEPGDVATLVRGEEKDAAAIPLACRDDREAS